MNQLIRRILDKLGIRILKTSTYNYLKNNQITAGLPNNMLDSTMKAGLLRCKARTATPSTIIDVGAAQGAWSYETMNIWNMSKYLLFEPLEERKQQLYLFAQQYRNVIIVNKGAGSSESKANFIVSTDLDGSRVEDGNNLHQTRTIEITTIDEQIKKHNLNPPFLIKLDTHGYEIPILDGAVEVLKQTSLVIIECYGYKITKDSLLFWEMCDYMLTLGFRLIDIVDIMYRPIDNTFWQCDAFFIPSNSVCFANNNYAKEI